MISTKIIWGMVGAEAKLEGAEEKWTEQVERGQMEFEKVGYEKQKRSWMLAGKRRGVMVRYMCTYLCEFWEKQDHVRMGMRQTQKRETLMRM